MTKKPSPANVPGNLRVRAEQLLAAGGIGLQQLPPEDVLELVHELQVHQIELEMQNEELLRAQEAITGTGNRYADLYDFAPVGYVTLDPQGLINEINLTGARLLGAPRNSLLQKPFILLVAPFDRQAFYAYLKHLPAGGAPQSSELEINPLQGPLCAISLESLAMVQAGGQVIQYRMAITDITRRRNAEDDLRRSEEKFRLLYEKAPLGYQSLDENGIIREVNQAWLDVLGYSRQEVIGRRFDDFLPPDYFELFPERFSCLKDTGEVCNVDFEMVRKDGARITVSFSARVAFDDQGRFVRTHCMFQDVTARQQAEEALRATEERLRLKLDSILSPDAAIVDEDLSNILDTPAIQALMEDFTSLTGMAIAILDLQGQVLVATGWQDICTQYHRVHPQAAQNCTQSDLFLAQNLRPGEYVAHKCQNHLWDVATPLFIGNKHVGNIYTGQFFYDDEAVDEQLFIDQAAKYGFDQGQYLSALQRVPRISRARVKPLMDFLTKFSALVSKLSFSNLKLAKAMSEQRQIEATLRQSKEHFRRLTKLSPVPVVIINRQGDIEYLNDRFLTTFGYNLDDIPNMEAWWRCAYPDEHHRLKGMANWRKAVEKAAREDTDIAPSESRVTCKDGTVRIAEIIGTRIGNKNLVILQDITERKQAEAALQASEALFREAQRIAHIGSWSMNLTDNIIKWSDEMYRIYGVTKDEFPHTPESFLKLLHPDDRPRMERWVEETIAQIKTPTLDFRVVLPDGNVRHIRGEGGLITDQSGNPERLTGTAQDITARKQTETERDRMFNLSLDIMCIGGLDGFFKQVNPAGEKMLGWTDQELLMKPWIEYVHPEDRAATIAAGEQLAAGEAVYAFQNRYRCRDGSYRWLSWNAFPLLEEGLIFFVGRDVTERKRAEAEIVRQSSQLRALAARLANVEETGREHLARELHDQVCQSLTALSLTLTLLQTQMPPKAATKLRGRMAGAVALVEQIGETIRDVMAELRPPMLDDYGLLSALHWYGTEFSGKTGIGVDVQGQEAVPRLAAPVELAMFRIVQEAMANVAKHAQATGVVLTQAEDNGTVRLVIADNGVGFDQERLGQPEGRHLWGLMTMSERAAAAGGRCRIESQPGQGTRVVVEVSR
ncbi:MAG: PAS domain S-box protein [Deltaproteobacteria bacterium]|nr:PAS domain S-box protein [Deltaproteobacteria bacterium]